MNKKALKISIIVIATLAVVAAVITLVVWLCIAGSWSDFVEGKFEYSKSSAISNASVDDGENVCFVGNIEIEYASVSIEKIPSREYRKQDGKNVIKNPKNGLTYKVALYIQFVGEDEGRFYDIHFIKTYSRDEYAIVVDIFNDELGIHEEKQMVLTPDDMQIRLGWDIGDVNVKHIDLYIKE